MPDLGGGELLARLRELPGMAAVPIVVLSGTDRDVASERGYASGVFAHLTKPADPATIVETVRRAIEAAG
ncbi:MAG TPA: response regulator [Actinomycetota bacterium]